MPLNIVKRYKGQNIIKVRRSSGKEEYGYQVMFRGQNYVRVAWNTKAGAEDARDKLKQRLRSDGNDEYKANPLTIIDLLNAWEKRARSLNLSANRVSRVCAVLNRLKDVAASQNLIELTEDDLIAYQASRLRAEKPVHNHTIIKELAMIRTAFLAAKSLFPGFKWIPPELDKSRRLKSQYIGREVVISNDEHHRLVAALEGDAAITGQTPKRKLTNPKAIKAENTHRALTLDAYWISFETALRISEIARIEKTDVHFQRGIGSPHGLLRLTSAKTGKRESVPLTPRAAAILKRRSETWPGKYVFHTEGKTVESTVQKIRSGLIAACKRAGIHYGLKTEGIVFHTTRHTLTSRLVNQGHDLATVGEITRHSKATMVLRYSHSTIQSRVAAINSMSFQDDSDTILIPETKEQS